VIIELNNENYEQEVIKSDRPVIVDFWGPQCGPCLALSPHVDQLAEVYGGKVKVAKLDASKNRRLCLSLKVLGLPTFLFYKNGQECQRLIGGALKIEEIEDAMKKLIE
jgi:thioredoxin 1